MVGGVLNAFNELVLSLDTTGLIESCDCCNQLIYNWDTLTNCFVSFDNKIVCQRCNETLDTSPGLS
jgi:hypothetical protein